MYHMSLMKHYRICNVGKIHALRIDLVMNRRALTMEIIWADDESYDDYGP